MSQPPRDPIQEEADRLFPTLRAPPSEPKLRPPAVHLGRNPYSEMRRLLEHEQHLASLNAQNQRKADAVMEAREEQRKQKEALLHPAPLPLPEDYVAAAERGERVSQILPPLRKPLPNTVSNTAATAAAPVLNSAIGLPPQQDEPSGSLAVTHSLITTTNKKNHSQQWVDMWGKPSFLYRIYPQCLTAEELKSASKTQLAKYKVEKHRGYFGPRPVDLLSTSSWPANFEKDVDKLLSMPPGTAEVTSTLQGESFLLSKAVLGDDLALAPLFGAMRLKGTLPKVTAVLSRDIIEATPGSSKPPSDDLVEQLVGLRLELTGKPPLDVWPGDPLHIELRLSRYSYSVKHFTITTSAKRVSNIFDRFAVDGALLLQRAALSLRCEHEIRRPFMEVSNVLISGNLKSRHRHISAMFSLPIFDGRLRTNARLAVDGSYAPCMSEIAITDTGSIRIDMTLRVPDIDPSFSFRSASSTLSFLDEFVCKNLCFRLIALEKIPYEPVPADHTAEEGSDSPAGTELEAMDDDLLEEDDEDAAEASRALFQSALTVQGKPQPQVTVVSVDWEIRSVPLMHRMFDGEPFVTLTSVPLPPLRSSTTSHTTLKHIELRSPEPSQRSMTLWNLIQLKNIVAFVQCEDGDTSFGAYCTAQLDLNGQSLEFVGKMVGGYTESLSQLPPHVQRPSAVNTPLTFTGSLVASSGLWTCVAGCPFLHLRNAVLTFEVGSVNCLPTYVRVEGTSMLQNCGSLGLSSGSSLESPCVVEFPIDAFPHCLVMVQLTQESSDGNKKRSSSASSTSRAVGLDRVVQSLWLAGDSSDLFFDADEGEGGTTRPPLQEQDPDENVEERTAAHRILTAASLVQLIDATLVWNSSPRDALLSSLSSSSKQQSFLPGATIRVRDCLLKFPTPARASGDLLIESFALVEEGQRRRTPSTSAASSRMSSAASSMETSRSSSVLGGATTMFHLTCTPLIVRDHGNFSLKKPLHEARFTYFSAKDVGRGPTLSLRLVAASSATASRHVADTIAAPNSTDADREAQRKLFETCMALRFGFHASQIRSETLGNMSIPESRFLFSDFVHGVRFSASAVVLLTPPSVRFAYHPAHGQVAASINSTTTTGHQESDVDPAFRALLDRYHCIQFTLDSKVTPLGEAMQPFAQLVVGGGGSGAAGGSRRMDVDWQVQPSLPGNVVQLIHELVTGKVQQAREQLTARLRSLQTLLQHNEEFTSREEQFVSTLQQDLQKLTRDAQTLQSITTLLSQECTRNDERELRALQLGIQQTKQLLDSTSNNGNPTSLPVSSSVTFQQQTKEEILQRFVQPPTTRLVKERYSACASFAANNRASVAEMLPSAVLHREEIGPKGNQLPVRTIVQDSVHTHTTALLFHETNLSHLDQCFSVGQQHQTALQTLISELTRLESEFASDVVCETVRIVGSFTTNPVHANAATRMFQFALEVTGTVSSKQFRVLSPCLLPLDHRALLSAVDCVTREILRLYTAAALRQL